MSLTDLDNCQRKRRYPSREHAQRAAGEQMRMDTKTPDLFVYECFWCGGWHLTRGDKATEEPRRRQRL